MVSSTRNAFANQLSDINLKSVEVGEARKCESFSLSSQNHDAGIPLPSSAPEIEFVGVSYRYPTAVTTRLFPTRTAKYYELWYAQAQYYS